MGQITVVVSVPALIMTERTLCKNLAKGKIKIASSVISQQLRENVILGRVVSQATLGIMADDVFEVGAGFLVRVPRQ